LNEEKQPQQKEEINQDNYISQENIKSMMDNIMN